MFDNTKVTHRTYGKGIITHIEIDPKNELDSYIAVTFDSGEEKLFLMRVFYDDRYFSEVGDPEISEFVKSLMTEDDIPKKRRIIRYSTELETEVE